MHWIKAIAVDASDNIFILYGIGHVRILSKTDGSLVGTLRQNVNGWKGSDGQVDAAYGMTVTKRSSGEYVILFENAAWANIPMYRWHPSTASGNTRPIASRRTALVAKGFILGLVDGALLARDNLGIRTTGVGGFVAQASDPVARFDKRLNLRNP